jgi:hypothetical protein
MDHGLGVWGMWGVHAPSLPFLQCVHALYHVMCDVDHTVTANAQMHLVVSETVYHSSPPLAKVRYALRHLVCHLYARHACPVP